jgi:hypothetical protein
MQKIKPIFIIGNGRSGTTMLGQILTKANVGVSFEGHFVVKALQKFGLEVKSKSDLQSLIKFIQGFESSKRFNFTLDAACYDVSKKLSTKQILTDALDKIANKHNQSIWIEKTPHYINDLDLILKVFPNARIIWMLRDGRDVANSVFKKSWGPNNYLYAAKDWVHSNCNSGSLNDRRVLRVKYEDLLTTPNEGLTGIFNFLEFSCDNVEELAARINPAKMYQWKKKMNKREHRVFESVAFDCLTKFGYQTVNAVKPNIPWYEVAYYSIHHNCLWGQHLIRANIVMPVLIKLGAALPFDEKN